MPQLENSVKYWRILRNTDRVKHPMAKYKSPKLPFDVVTLETFSNTKTPENVRFPKRKLQVQPCMLTTYILQSADYS